jgi:hypothetical protein
MIHLKSMTLRKRLLCLVWPAYRRRHDAALREAIRALVQDPSLPCMIEGRLIPNGYGANPFAGI